MQYGPDQVPVSNTSVIVGPPTRLQPVPVTTTETIIHPPVYEPSVAQKPEGNVIVTEPYAVAVADHGNVLTNKVTFLNFTGNIVTSTESNGNVTVDIIGDGFTTTVLGGTGISVNTSNNVATVTNTGILDVVSSDGISVDITDGVATITNTGILDVQAGNSISVDITDGVATVTNTFTETVYNGGNWTGNVTPNRDNGTIQKYTLTGNITLTPPTNVAVGQSLTLILTQGGSGQYTLTANSAYLFAGSYNTLSTSVGAIDMMNMFYDGTYYYVTLTVGYA